MSGRYVLGSGQLAELNLLLSSILTQVTYLDTCSIGRTSDFICSLDSIVKYVNDCKKICNKAHLL